MELESISMEQPAAIPVVDAGATAADSDDVRLLDRLRAGDDRAFDELVAATGARLLAVARRLLINEDDASDAVQDAYLSAFKSLDRFDGRARLSTWLHRITVNSCLMKLRTLRRRPERSIEDLLPQFTADGHQRNPTRSWTPTSEKGIEDRELFASVREKLNQIPDQYRVVLVLRDVEGLDTEEAATVLGISTSAVKTRLHRAHQALRELLTPDFTGKQP